jgi:hypothetical protein
MRAREWNKTDTIVLVALFIGICMGTLSGYNIALDHYDFQVDNVVQE